jgi:hypothetical protein
MNFTEIRPGERIKGLIPGESVQIITTQAFDNDAFETAFRKNDGSLGQQIVYADALGTLSPETDDLPQKFDADAARVRLASSPEAIYQSPRRHRERLEKKLRFFQASRDLHDVNLPPDSSEN